MSNLLQRFNSLLKLLGFDIMKLVLFFRGVGFYYKDYQVLKRQQKESEEFVFGKFYPVLDERFSESGTMGGHYFHQDLLVARKLYQNNPVKHVDIGSRTDGFIAHVAVFREIEIFDIREQLSAVQNIKFKQADLMKLPNEMRNYCDSASSLHVIEHFGLGRYGDPIDFEGHLKALNNIHMMIKKGGKFYFSVPIGSQRIEFNAHRVFDISYLLRMFEGKFVVDDFSYVDDNGVLFENVMLTEESIDTNFNCNFGCGIFELSKV